MNNGLALLKTAESIYARAEAAGLGENDMIALYKLLNK